jgi:hypothetical protein
MIQISKNSKGAQDIDAFGRARDDNGEEEVEKCNGPC